MSETPAPDRAHRFGFVTLIGRPNVGKSTLLNQILGEKLAIISHRPQTTRNRIPGVLTRPDAQVVLIDTPGLHRAERALNAYMVEVAHEALWQTDAVALIVEAGIGKQDEVGIGETVESLLPQLTELGKPVVLVLNKIDRIDKPRLLPIIGAWREVFPFTAIVPISALTGDGVDALVGELVKVMPEGPALYAEDALTDLPERFIAAELIREKLFHRLEAEVPYSTAVTIESWADRSRAGAVDIEAVIHVERESQKGIVIGKGGQMIKTIGTQARLDLERLLGTRVNLRLFVRVEKAWTQTPGSLRKLGYES